MIILYIWVTSDNINNANNISNAAMYFSRRARNMCTYIGKLAHLSVNKE